MKLSKPKNRSLTNPKPKSYADAKPDTKPVRQQKSKAHTFADALTSAQCAKLKGLAHSLKPLLQVGGEGLSDALIKELFIALKAHELIKIQLTGQSDAAAKEIELAQLTSKLPSHTHIVGRIGRTVILFQEADPALDAKVVLKTLR